MTEETNKGNKEIRSSQPFVKRSAEKIAEQSMLQLRKFAAFLQHKSELLSSRNKLIILVVFLLTGSACSLYLIINALAGKYQISFTSLNHLPSIDRTETEVKNSKTVITKKDYLAVRNFRKYLDSIEFSPGGKAEYEKIIHERAGLLDSMDKIEQIYKQQQKDAGK